MTIEAYVPGKLDPQPTFMGDDCVSLLRTGVIPFCNVCGSIVVNPMIHEEWCEKVSKKCES